MSQYEQELREKLEDYEKLLAQMINDATSIGTVLAGPFSEEGKDFYRVNVGGSEMMLFSIVNEKIEIGSEVVGTNTFISKVLPAALNTKKEIPKFKHIGWEEVGGLKSQIEDIRKIVEGPIKHRDLYKEYNIDPPKGILLHGPPGCGKTLISKVIASQIIGENGNVNSFTYLKGPEILQGLVGASEETIRKLFQNARANTIETGERSVIFIDEAEAILSKRGTGISSDVNKTIVPQFLSEMDGFDEHSPFILLSTNRPSDLDPAIIREGRVDLKVEIKRPSQDDAREIFDIHLKDMKLADDRTELIELAVTGLYQTGIGVSGSMIKTIVNTSAQESLYRFLNGDEDNKGIASCDIEKTLEKLQASNTF
jgi:SpoVK/Ycf46/Vps4 family AAA+-type ATPase